MATTNFVDRVTPINASWLNDVDAATYEGTGVFTPAGTGAVATTVQTKLRESVSVKDFGATGDGTTDDTTAVTNAINSVTDGGEVFFPPGNYLVTPISISGLDNVTLRGANKFTSILKLSASGTLLTLPNAQWCKVEKLGFQSNGSPQTIANAYGLQFDTGAGNNTIDDCEFLGFSKDGLRLIGTLGTQLSGHKVTNCYFLGNGNYQFYSVYSNDFHYEDNQFGMLSGITKALVGSYLSASSAGTYKGNYHWSNEVGLRADSCNYNTYSLNRIEESNAQNVYIDGGAYTIFSMNKCHTASVTTSGASDNVYITNASEISFVGNLLFSFTADTSRWGVNFDTGCSAITLSKNRISSFAAGFGPYNFASGVTVISGDFDMFGLTGAATAAGQTTYVGAQLNTFSEGLASFSSPRKAQAIRMFVASDTAPGAAQTFTYTLRKSSVDTAMTAAISGAASFSASALNTTPAILFPVDTTISMKLVTSAGAAAGNQRWVVSFAEY